MRDSAGDYGPDDLRRDLDLHDSAIARIETHRALLAEWSQRMNLIGPKELDQYWRRHALDSAQLVRIAPTALRWLDLGAGAGFPGLIVAALIADARGAQVFLVESIGKKAAFLREAIQAMGVPATVLHRRAEDLVRSVGRVDVVTARAFAPLPRIMDYARPLMIRGAVGLFLKGADLDSERAAAEAAGWTLEAETLESRSDPRGRILRVTSARR
jgi:16S rRNA (guanine527-N7)-methyltransferase